VPRCSTTRAPPNRPWRWCARWRVSRAPPWPPWLDLVRTAQEPATPGTPQPGAGEQSAAGDGRAMGGGTTGGATRAVYWFVALGFPVLFLAKIGRASCRE